MVQILDQYGSPLRKDALNTQQTASVGQIVRTWPTHPSKGLAIDKLPRILQLAEMGDLAAQADLFEDMKEKDGHIFSEMAKRKNALLGLDWAIQPPENATANEKKITEQVSEWMRAIPDLEDVTLNAAEAIGHGFACQELEWEREDGVWLPSKFHLRSHRWFCTTPDTNDEIRLNDGSMPGGELWPFGWLVHTHNAKSGFIAQSGLYRVLVWPYLFKNYSTRDLAEFLEVYGLPMRVGTYMQGASDEEKNKLLAALVMLGRNAAGIIPQGTEIKFESAAQGQADPFVAMIEWCERTESKVILGGTLTSQADGKTSTNALGNVHNEVRHDILVADARQLEGFYRGFIRMVLAINGEQVSPRRQPKLVFDTREVEDIASFSTGVKNLVEAGLATIPTSYIHRKLGIPEPKEGEPVLSVVPAAAPLPAAANARLLAAWPPLAALATQQQISDPAQAALDNAQTVPEQINQAMQTLISPVVAALNEGQSPDEAMAALTACYPKLDDDQLITLLRQALFVADIWGQLNAHG